MTTDNTPAADQPVPGDTQVETTTAAAAMDAWTMTTSILVGLHKARVQADAEYAEKFTAANGIAYGPGVSTAADIRRVLEDTLIVYENEVNRIARMNRFPLPEMPR